MNDPRVVQALAEIKAIVERLAEEERADAEKAGIGTSRWRIGWHVGRASMLHDILSALS